MRTLGCLQGLGMVGEVGRMGLTRVIVAPGGGSFQALPWKVFRAIEGNGALDGAEQHILAGFDNYY